MDRNEIAGDILDRCIHERWQPTGAELLDAYNISESTLQKVKQNTRALAADKDVVWGWDPDLESYRVCPHNDSGTYKRMVTYYHDAWNAAGKSLVFTVDGGRAMGYLTESTRDELVEFYEGVTKKVDGIRHRIVVIDPDDNESP